jgi:predicted 3-demethylubiquinone-9 3-methyltransferase (glyoxalase superfamily)
MQSITPSLWFNNNAEEAMNYYVGVFKNSEITHIEYYPDESLDEHFKGMSGKVFTGIFELDGLQFTCLDGGPLFPFTEAVSFTVPCADQAEIDYYWERLSHVPEAEQCGWCKDKFGISWQIVPSNFDKWMKGDDSEAVKRVVPAFMNMHKIDIAQLEAAYAGE